MTTRAARAPVRRAFRNDKAVFLWGFTAAWFVMLALFTHIAVRDGGIPEAGAWSWPVLALFWLAGLGLARWASTLPRVHVALTPDGLVVRERFPFSTTEKRYRARDLAAPRIDESKDGDGDPYYALMLELPGGRRIAVAEGHHRPEVEAVLGEFSAGLAAARHER